MTLCPPALGTSSSSHTTSWVCPTKHGDVPCGSRKSTKWLLSCPFLLSLAPPHLTHGKFSPLRREVLEKHSLWVFRVGAHLSYGGLIKTHPVSRIRLYLLRAPKPNFLWISDHLLFPIMLLFTLSIWRIQMLNDKRERRRRGREKNSILPEG